MGEIQDILIALGLVGVLMPTVFGLMLLVRRVMKRQDAEIWAPRWLRRSGLLGMSQPQYDGKTLIELERLRLADRDKARALFERLSMEKLDVLKTSIQSGYKEDELARLDERLERIIGSERLQQLLAESTAPAAPPAVAGTVLHSELPSAPLSSSADGGQPLQQQGLKQG